MTDLSHLREEIPGFVYVALGRRGREKISTDQCFAPGCGSESPDDLEFTGRKVDVERTGDVVVVRASYTVKCGVCGRSFVMEFRTTGTLVDGESFEEFQELLTGKSAGEPLPPWREKLDVAVNLLTIFSEEGENWGQVGYF
ncbi:MAG: hypothetical protein Kow0069_21040 [Promethearchaeota archaeon]